MQKVHDPSKNRKWVDYPNIESPIIADELNRHEIELDTIDSRVVVHETTKANQVDLLTCVAGITLNTTTGILTITLKNGSSTTIDTGLSKLAVNFDYDADPESEHYQQLILVMKDGSKQYIDLSALITQFEFTNSATITWTVGNDGTVTANIINGSITEAMLETNFLANCRLEVSKALGFSQDAEAWAKGTKGGTPVASTDEHYHNNAKYYSEVAHTEADNATTKAQDSEAWAVGKRNGQDVPSTDETYHNNAKYWAEQAEGAVTGNDKVTWEANGILGAKNLIPYPYDEVPGTKSGITFEVDNDGIITVSGEKTTAGLIQYYPLRDLVGYNGYLFDKLKVGESYTLSGCPSGGSGSTYALRLILNYQKAPLILRYVVDTGNGITFTVTDEVKYARLMIDYFGEIGTDYGELIFKPMLRLAEDLDSEYQPYAMTNKELTDELKGKVDWATNGKLGAKNLIPYPYYETTKTVNGITFTDNGDGTITVNGTATSKANFWLGHYSLPFIYPNGSYLLSDGGVGSSDVTLFFAYYNGTTRVTQNNVFDNGEIPIIVSHSASSNYDRTPIGINVTAGTTVSNLTFKPMLRLAEDTDNTYQPYARTNKQLTDDIKDVWKANGRLGAKNLVPYPFFNPNPTYTKNGVTFTDNGDGTITANGTASSSANANCHFIARIGSNYKLPLGKYILTGCLEGGSSTTYRIGVNRTVSGSTSTYGYDYGSGFIFEVTDDTATTGCFIEIIKGVTVNNIVFKPMLRIAEDTDDTFQPYAKTNQQLTEDSPFRFGVDGNGNYGYIKAGADTVTPFRNPKGNAVVANVLSGKTFANASSDELTGTMANYGGSNRQTITVSAGTGTQQISLSAGYHDSVIVDRTNAYVAGQNNIRNKEWGEPIEFCDNVWIQREVLTDTVIGYSNPRVGISCSNFSRLVKDAVWGEGDSIFVVGFYEKYQYWENTALGGNHGGIAMSSISTVSDATLGWHPNAIMLTHASNYNDTHGGELRGELTSSSGYGVSHSGTVYLSLYRKGIQ